MVSPSRRRWHFLGVPVARARAFCSSWQTPTIRPRGAAGGFALQPLALVGACAAGSAGRVVVCHGDPFTVMGWAALLALLQLAWYLAQPWTLRTASPLSAALVRAGPPVVALVLTVTAARAWPAESPHGLLLAAACGYAVGALWLRSARLEGRTTQPPQQHSPEPPPPPRRQIAAAPACAWPTPR